ncbi:hypothetical protein GGI35DRAFT_265039 [Trichoderma velutinum]
MPRFSVKQGKGKKHGRQAPKLLGQKEGEANSKTKVNGRALENTHSACTVAVVVPDLISITASKTHSHTVTPAQSSPPSFSAFFSCDWAVMPNIQLPLANHPPPAVFVNPCPPVMVLLAQENKALLPFRQFLSKGGVVGGKKRKKQRSGLSDGNASRKGFSSLLILHVPHHRQLIPFSFFSCVFFFLLPFITPPSRFRPVETKRIAAKSPFYKATRLIAAAKIFLFSSGHRDLSRVQLSIVHGTQARDRAPEALQYRNRSIIAFFSCFFFTLVFFSSGFSFFFAGSGGSCGPRFCLALDGFFPLDSGNY